MTTYDLHRLGWHSFQQLCLTIVREVLGQTVESFLDAGDGGRDGAFSGTWRQSGSEDIFGQFVIQCKFTSSPNRRIRIADLGEELPKAKRLVDAGRCDSYVLLTNLGISGNQAEQIARAFRKVGVTHTRSLGVSWINQQIHESKRLRMLVPRVYGLGDLSQILDERCYAQARALLASLREDLARVVITNAYQKAISALEKHGFVLLVGEPAAGKSTIASLLAMTALDQWAASTIKCETAHALVEHWNPDEPSQFFWVDDAFGTTQYEDQRAREWNHVVPQIKAMLRQVKIVMTSRDYIYRSARQDLKESAFPLLQESQVVIDVRDLSIDEKRQILYNHIKLGRQPQKWKKAIKPLLESVATHQLFAPETARRLGDPAFTKGLALSGATVVDFVVRREQFLRETINGLDVHSKAALAVVYMRNDHLESPVQLEVPERDALERLGSDLGRLIPALAALDGSFLQRVQVDDTSFWRYKHPTIGDAFAGLLVGSPELLGIFVQGSSPEKLIEQVTCGDVGLERAVVVPKPLFGLMARRLDELGESPRYKTSIVSQWQTTSMVQGFLARRCSRDFLVMYVGSHPTVWDAVAAPGLFLDAVSEVPLAVRLNNFGLLPEAVRQAFVSAVSEYAVEGEDLYALDNHGVRSVFTPREFRELRERVRAELLPRITDVRYEWESRHSDDADAAQPLLESFEVLKREFGGDPAVKGAIDWEIEALNSWMAEHQSEGTRRSDRPLGSISPSERSSAERSVFDDIDS